MKKKKQTANKLLQAMQLLSLCQKNEGQEMHCYSNLQDNRAIAFDGVVAAGSTIIEDLDSCPHTYRLMAALEVCGETFALTQLSPTSLLVRSGDFQAFIPCCEREKLPQAAPDNPVCEISPALMEALKIVAPLANEKAGTVIQASVLISAGSALATNRITILEAWHGCDLPVMLIPKQAVKALLDSGRTPTKFGYSGKTATFWFDDHSWLRTQLYQEGTKDLQSYLNQPHIVKRKMPKEFFEAVDKVLSVSVDGNVYCWDGSVSSHLYSDRTGSKLSIDVKDGPVNVCYSHKELKYFEKYAEEFDENHENFTLFFSGKVRGAIWHERIKPPKSCGNPDCDGSCDICLPF